MNPKVGVKELPLIEDENELPRVLMVETKIQ